MNADEIRKNLILFKKEQNELNSKIKSLVVEISKLDDIISDKDSVIESLKDTITQGFSLDERKKILINGQ